MLALIICTIVAILITRPVREKKIEAYVYAKYEYHISRRWNQWVEHTAKRIF